MVHEILDVDKLSFGTYYQKGEGLIFYKGSPPYQRGHGIISKRIHGDGLGSIVRRVWRVLLPILKSGGKAVAKEGVATAARVLTDISMDKKTPKDAIIEESAEGMKNLLEKAKGGVEGLKSMVSKAEDRLVQSGSGMRKSTPRRRKTSVIRKKASKAIGEIILSPSPSEVILKKRRRRDTFGFY